MRNNNHTTLSVNDGAPRTLIKKTNGMTQDDVQNFHLSHLGIYGWDNLEDFLLAGLLTGDGVLLVGPHGCAKTHCVRQIAHALNTSFQKVDASKAEFEDYLGFPNPRALSEGRFECVPTPTSISDKDFLFIDEINRAKPQTQNKLLEIVYSRQIMGLPIRAKWVWGAMNIGEEYSGLETLDAAFVSRFAFIIPVPNLTEMSERDIEQVILRSKEVSNGEKDFSSRAYSRADCRRKPFKL